MKYICSCCGEAHDGLPDIAFDRPDYAAGISTEDQAPRLVLTEDLCAVEDEHYFIRGVVEIPIRDHPETFGIGVWVSQKRENFDTYARHPDSAEIGPFFGWLSNEFSFAGESSLHLKTRIHFLGGGRRPAVELEPTDHALAVAQREGILFDEAWRFVHELAPLAAGRGGDAD